jgi:hypothetical protein
MSGKTESQGPGEGSRGRPHDNDHLQKGQKNQAAAGKQTIEKGRTSSDAVDEVRTSSATTDVVGFGTSRSGPRERLVPDYMYGRRVKGQWAAGRAEEPRWISPSWISRYRRRPQGRHADTC